MRWKRNGPKHADRRIVKRFAFLPVFVGNIVIWLEIFKVQQIFIDSREGSCWIDEKIIIDH